MRRLVTILAALSLMAFAGAAFAGRGGVPVPPFPHLPGTWSHAEINVTIKRVPHTLILDRGRIVQVSFSQLTLRERDGSIVFVPLSQSTIVGLGIGNRPATVFDLKKRMSAMTMRIDGGAAVRVRATAF